MDHSLAAVYQMISIEVHHWLRTHGQEQQYEVHMIRRHQMHVLLCFPQGSVETDFDV